MSTGTFYHSKDFELLLLSTSCGRPGIHVLGTP